MTQLAPMVSMPPGVGRIGNPLYAKYQVCWAITENPKEPYFSSAESELRQGENCSEKR